MKKKAVLLVFLVCLSFFGCQKNETVPITFQATVQTTNEQIKHTENQVETQIPTQTLDETLPETTDAQEEHVHNFEAVSLRDPTCTEAGEKIWRCACGENKVEILPKQSHRASMASCTEASVCASCAQTLQTPLGHEFENQICLRCGLKITTPIFVLDTMFDFDESQESIESKLGAPTERIFEGNIVSLVYSADYSRFTVIQTDDHGLWGVFTMDASASFCLENKDFSISNFSGTRDVNSEAYYQDAGSCRLFGFRDTLNGGEYYGLWMRYFECAYDYMEDPALCSTFGGQNRLSYHYTNALRVKAGLAPLTWSDEAAAVALEYSETMVKEGFFHHDGSYANRLQQKGIFWKNAGENISQGYFNALFVCDAYYNSTSHRENILSANFTHVGMGYYLREDPKTVFGAQIFFGK